MTQTLTVEGTRASYLVREITADTAAGFGCPGATHELTGRHGHIIGSIRPVTGRLTRRGVLAVFTPWGAPETGEPFRGYANWILP